MSSRPTGTTRASWPTRSTTVGRPSGSLAVVTTPSGLLQQNVSELLLADALAVDLDDIARGDEGVELAARPVDRDAARLDQLVRRPAGGDAGAGEVAVESHARHCR